ncbi:DNA polymerase III subunit gamma/tau [Botrimarina hoheduenensis]|uniref:DNA polymerase III subunit gamma/tau n=1 Tax=Botrimarina hoheduenensis TaxID=2528000 RepID=A0A5C5WC16_9BACT|nr:DNA polymerase III subunit gamma/tau [Botrimarina hoheduenensis]TWT47619.1 DNA polymerase III subunit tau [Botrimarina hoheduenensis]
MSDAPQADPPVRPHEPAPPKPPEAKGEYVVVARRYRPQLFSELIGQEHVARALEQAIRSGRIGHAYLFTGARGVGKTSAARILSKALNCESGPTPTPCNACDSCQRVASGDDVDVLEIDGASNRGIDEIRLLRQNAGIRPSRSRFKVYIIDEVHMLTKEAFNALLKTLEEPPEHVKFVFATTEPNKIPITILSRCQRFDFAGVEAPAIGQRLAQIAQAEGVAIDAEALQILSIRAAGSMRDSQSLLEQLLAVADHQITAENVYALLGIAPAARIAELAERLAERDAASGLAAIDAAIHNGADPGQLLDQLVGYYRDAMAAAVGCPAERMLHALPAQFEQTQSLGKRLGVNTLLAILQVLDHTAARMRVSVYERTLLDMAVVRIAAMDDLDELAQAVADLKANPAAAVVSAPPAASRVAPPATNPRASGSGDIAAQPTPQPSPASSSPAAPLPSPPPSASPPTAAPASAGSRPGANEPESAETQGTATVPPTDGLVAQLAAQLEHGAAKPQAVSPRRPNRRQQQAEIADRPFVRRALELFDIEPDKLKYFPPKEGGP